MALAQALKKTFRNFVTPPQAQSTVQAYAGPVHKSGYRSAFGGLWTDRTDFDALLAAKIASGNVSEAMAEKLRFWRKNGYVILEKAVDPALIDQLYDDINRAWASKDDRFTVQTGHGAYIPLSEATRMQPLTKLLDVYGYSEAGRQASFAPAIRDFLATVFERDVLAFQNLTFEVGSTQAVHQDTAYVVTSSPLELAASWIAMEDVQEGSGELVYYPGSHEYPDYLFGGQHKHWDIARDGKEDHDRFLKHLHLQAEERGLTLEKFRPKKGDALIWSADLAHGGGPISLPDATRKSYVTHYCPNDVVPHYFTYLPPAHHKKIEVAPGCFISSSIYKL